MSRPLGANMENVIRRDVSTEKARRLVLRVEVPSPINKATLTEIANRLIGQGPPTNAIVLFFYKRGTDMAGSYTAGCAVWAPYGDWSRAGEVKTEDQSKHRLVVVVGVAKT